MSDIKVNLSTLLRIGQRRRKKGLSKALPYLRGEVYMGWNKFLSHWRVSRMAQFALGLVDPDNPKGITFYHDDQGYVIMGVGPVADAQHVIKGDVFYDMTLWRSITHRYSGKYYYKFGFQHVGSNPPNEYYAVLPWQMVPGSARQGIRYKIHQDRESEIKNPSLPGRRRPEYESAEYIRELTGVVINEDDLIF